MEMSMETIVGARVASEVRMTEFTTGKVYYPPEPDGMDRKAWERDVLRPWRMEVKEQLFLERGCMCERCGGAASDLDEGCVTRGDMRGLSAEQKRIAFASVNLFILCAECNRYRAHQRDWAFWQASKRYGENVVRDWYLSIGLKVPRVDFLPVEVDE